ncbi:unnamed protein product, partial [Symbiodinium necroappetens]
MVTYAAGCFLLAVFARARFSDMQGSGIMTEDVTTTADGPKGYLESSVTRTKTAYTLERKTRYLAMCAPVQGFTDSWALAWRELARNEGPTVGVDRPLLPAPVESGGWQEDPSAVRALGTHSMKGYFAELVRKVGIGQDSDVVYGRDNVAPALRALEPILEAIAMKRFKPDSTRSGMFEGLREPEPRPEDDEISLSSEGSEDEENKDFAAEDEAVDAVVGRWEPSEGLRDFLERAPVYRHSITRFLHVVASEEGMHFKCGRRISTSYAICESLPDVLFPVCKQCCPDVKNAEIGGEGHNEVIVCEERFALQASIAHGRASLAGRSEAWRLPIQIVVASSMLEWMPVASQLMMLPRRLTQPERSERYDKQCKKLSGITIKGASEPSEALVDKAVSAYEGNELRYIPWDACTSREQEVTSERKKDTRFTVDENTGKLKVEAKDPEDKACTTSEVHVLQALQRRSLAMDQANLSEYTLMQQWSDRILRARMDEPPPQYTRPSWSQLVSADKKLFSELRDLTRDGVQSSSTGVRPIDKHLPAVMMSYDVVSLLQPMPMAKASGGTQATSEKERLGPYSPPP